MYTETMSNISIQNHELELTEIEQLFMDRAFTYANEALAAHEVPVGCIFVHKGDIVAVGRNTVNETKNATRHAEINCIDQIIHYCAFKNINAEQTFRDINVYVTVEPCIMCAAALFDLKVDKIIYGCQNDRFGGLSVFDVASVLKPGTQLKGGYRGNEALKLLKKFYKGTNPNAPLSKVKKKGVLS